MQIKEDLRYTGVRSGIYTSNYKEDKEMDHEASPIIKEEAMTSASTGTVYRDIPAYRDVETPSASVHYAERRRFQAKPREFGGEGSWRTYRSHFDRVASLNQWGEERLEHLWISLTGAALSFVEGLPAEQTTSYERLCIAMDQRFGAERLAPIHKAELLSRKRTTGESLSALGQDIRRLASCAYPDFPLDALEEIAVERFLDALEKPETRLAIHQSNPRTLDEAIEKGLQMEAWQLAEDKKHGGSKVRLAVEDERLRMIKDLQTKMEELQTTRKEMSGTKCYNCGKLGHISRNCRLPRKKDDSREVTCYNCGKKGHYANKCQAPRSGNE